MPKCVARSPRRRVDARAAIACTAALAAWLSAPTDARACSLDCRCPEDVAPWVVPAGPEVAMNTTFFVRDAAHWRLVHVDTGLVVDAVVTTLDDGDRAWVQPTLPLLPASAYRFEHDGDPFPVEPVELTTGTDFDLAPPAGTLEQATLGPSEDYDAVCDSGDVFSAVLQVRVGDDRPLPEWVGVQVQWLPAGDDTSRSLGLLGHVTYGQLVQITLVGTNAPLVDCPGAAAFTDLESFTVGVAGILVADGAGQRLAVSPGLVDLQWNRPPSSGGCMLDPPYGAYPAGDDDYGASAGAGAFEGAPLLPEPTPSSTGDAPDAPDAATTADAADAGAAETAQLDGSSLTGASQQGAAGASGSDEPLADPPHALPETHVELGCGCRAAGRTRHPSLAWLLLAPAAGLAWRRRRR